VEKYSKAAQDTDDNMAYARCLLDNCGYGDTLRICNTYSFCHGSNGYTNASQYYVYTNIAGLVWHFKLQAC